MFSIKAVSRATGLTVETLRAWERRYAVVAPRRDESGRRVYTIDDVTRLRRLRDATHRGHPIGRLARLSDAHLAALLDSMPTGVPAAIEAETIVARILAAAEHYEAVGCDQPLALATTLLPPEALIAEVLHPLLREVGERWHRGEFTVAQERLVSSRVRRHLGAALEAYARNAWRAPIVFATLPGEQHELGLLMSAVLCASRGHAIHYLGPDLPAVEIGRYALAAGARVVALSLVLRELTGQTPAHLQELAGAAGTQAEIWIGGPAARRLLRDTLPPGCTVVPDAAELRRRLDDLAAG